MKKLRAAVIGLDHVHTGTMIDVFSKNEHTELVGIAGYGNYTEEELQFQLSHHVPNWLKPAVYSDYKELLKQDLDIVVICTGVNEHTELVEETLALNINTIVEKPMALTMTEAKRMYRAYKASSAQLMINWPIAWIPCFRKVKELADSGIVGDVLRVEYRSPATCGPYSRDEMTPQEFSKLWWYRHSKGGGAIPDYAGYGCVLTTWIAGTAAKRVSGFKKNYLMQFSDVEDYATFTIDFGNCIGLIEASWSTQSNGQIPTGPIVYGTEGTIVADRFGTDVKVYKESDRYRPSCEPTDVYTFDEITDGVAENMINHILNGTPICDMTSPEFNMKAMAAFDAGIRSCESGNIETAYDPFGF